MLIDAPPTLLNTIIHKKHLSHFMAKTMNELAHKSPLIISFKFSSTNVLTNTFAFSGSSSVVSKDAYFS